MMLEEEKFSLFNELDNAMANNQYNGEKEYLFSFIDTIMINDIYISLVEDALLQIILQKESVIIKIIYHSEPLFNSEIDYSKIKNFHLIIRGE